MNASRLSLATFARALRPIGSFSAAALIATTVIPAASARADDSDACRDAEAFIGKAARKMTAEQCLEAGRAAEEEQWQLWLDLAFAEEASGDHEKAIDTLRRFVKATVKRGPDLAEPWPGLRDDAIFSIDRLEQGLLKTHGRIVIQTEPAGLKVRFVQEPRRGEDAAPVTRYLKPGTHVVAAIDPATKTAREISFTVEAGQNREIKLDLRPGSPVGTVERALPGDKAPVAAGGTTSGGTSGGVHTRHDDDDTAPPRTDAPTTALRRIGVAAIGVGIAAAAVGTGFMLTSSGLDGEADCSGNLCDFEAPTRARLRKDASIHENRAIGAFVTGGVFLVGGAILVALDMMKSNEVENDGADAGLRLKSIFPTVGAGQAGVGAALGF